MKSLRRQIYALVVLAAAALALQGVGCSLRPTHGDSIADVDASAPMDAGLIDKASVAQAAASAPVAPSPSSLCTATARGTQRKIAFTTALDCADEGEGACPTSHLTLSATSETDSTSQVAAATWTVMRGGVTIISSASRSADGVTTTELDYGAGFKGVRHATLRDDGATLRGSFDGREIVPITLATFHPADGVHFVDHAALPAIEAPSAKTLQGMARLLNRVNIDAPIVCQRGKEGSVVANADTALAVSRLVSLVSKQHPDDVTTGAALVTGVGERVIAHDVASAAFGPVGVPGTVGNSPTVSDRIGQNNTINWSTHDCQSCEASNARNPLCWGFQFWGCIAECFIPGNGCNEVTCPISHGVNTCDDGHACCGTQCCGASEVCSGDTSGSNVGYDLGYCCPKSFPVGCGDKTGAYCFKPGSTCCGTTEVACDPGSVCINVTGTTANCCAKDHLAKNGTCCERPTVDGLCCGAGESVCNGACCMGACVNGACCGGFGRAVCNGACCDGSCCGNSCCPSGQTCTTGGACCPSGQQACGGVCCGSGSTCADASKSQCSTGPRLEFWNPYTSTGSLGHSMCGITACEIEYYQSGFQLRGTGYSPGGSVMIMIAFTNAPQMFTANVDAAGTFLTTIMASGPPATVVVPIVATQYTPTATLQAGVFASFITIR